MDGRPARPRAHLPLGRVLVATAVGLGTAWLVATGTLAADSPVSIHDFSFDPASVTIAVGDSVTWTNADPVSHTATADGWSFDTGVLGNGDSATITFDTAGTFGYHCAIHPAMTATVVVQAAAGSASPSSASGPPSAPAGSPEPSQPASPSPSTSGSAEPTGGTGPTAGTPAPTITTPPTDAPSAPGPSSPALAGVLALLAAIAVAAAGARLGAGRIRRR